MRNYFNFPLYFDDNKSIEKISVKRGDAVKEFENKVKNGEYKYINNDCLCGHNSNDTDVEISLKDRFAISVKFLLCKKCSIIRTNVKLDNISLAKFYSKYYRRIYGNDIHSIEEEHLGQISKGVFYKKKLQNKINLGDISTVFDYGCGTGGALIPFKDNNRKLYGSDYNYDRLEFGNKNGLFLYHADDDQKKIKNKKYDLIILSHVMEHFATPLIEINNVFDLVAENGYIYIVIPSPMNIGKSPHITYKFFQNVHLYNFNKKYLILLFKKLGMDTVYTNDVCECILKKPKGWTRNNLDFYYDATLDGYYKNIVRHFRKVVILNDILKISSIKVIIILIFIKVCEFFKIKRYIKKILGR